MINFKLQVSFILIFSLFGGCRKFVEIDTPKSLLATTNTFTDDATATSAILGIYSNMVDKDVLPFKISIFTGLQADELKMTYDPYLSLYENNLTADNPHIAVLWLNAYNFIYQANAAFEGCNNSTSLNPLVKKQLMAESRFIRAFWNFYLVNLYGDVPLITTSDYVKNASEARASKDRVYQQIISDLQYAQDNLNENFVGANSISTSTDRVRPNKASASALLARVYLYTGKYAEAEVQSTAVINQNAVYKIEPVSMAFIAASQEAIWQLMKPTPTQIASSEAYYYIIDTKPITGSERQSTTISGELLGAFEDNDVRKSTWIGAVSDGADIYHFPAKYKGVFTMPPPEHTIVLRLAEQYLIRAEARAQIGNLEGAIADLDVLRDRAEIPLIRNENPAISKADLIKLILTERQKELFTEWGHRWLDLKRTQQIDSIMSMVTPMKGGVWHEYKNLWPIPEKELESGINLIQNPGYN